MQLVLAAMARPETEEAELLAKHIYELFRRNLNWAQLGAGQTLKTFDQNGLLLIRGAKFRRVKCLVTFK